MQKTNYNLQAIAHELNIFYYDFYKILKAHKLSNLR